MVRIKIPATTANLGCGYDTFGMALGYYNYVSVERASTFSVEIIGEGQKFLQSSSSNLVVRSAAAAFELAGQTMPNLAFVCENNIPLSRGMGSSSSAIIGGALAAAPPVLWPAFWALTECWATLFLRRTLSIWPHRLKATLIMLLQLSMGALLFAQAKLVCSILKE